MRRAAATVACALVAIGLTAPGGATAGSALDTPGSTTEPIIVDTDVDVDDAMAIQFLLRSRYAEVLGITVAGDGFLPLRDGRRVATQLTKLGGQPGVPVALGATRSLRPISEFPRSWVQQFLRFYATQADLPRDPQPPLVAIDAVDFMIDAIKRSDSKVSILGLAPNTNIAKALERDPTIVDNIKRIVLSGGAFDVPGDVVGRAEGSPHPRSEYNVFLDARAASIIARSGAPVTFVPLDASDHAPVTSSFHRLLQRTARTSSARFAAKAAGTLLSEGVLTFFWDPVVADVLRNLSAPHAGHVAIYDDACTQLRRIGVRVDERSGPNFGRTLAAPRTGRVSVCMDIAAGRFYERFRSTLNRPLRLQPPPGE